MCFLIKQTNESKKNNILTVLVHVLATEVWLIRDPEPENHGSNDTVCIAHAQK